MAELACEHVWEQYGHISVERDGQKTDLPLSWCVHCRETHPDDPIVTLPVVPRSDPSENQ